MRDINTEFQAASVNIREMVADKFVTLVRNIEKYAVRPRFFISKSIARATTSRGANSARSS
jgi:hypothetical protein